MATDTTYSPRTAFESAKQRVQVLDTSAITFTKSRATQAAASLAYYTFFSIFPLMLLLVLVGSYFLDRQNMVQRVTQAVQSALPISQQVIVQNLQQVLKARAAVGIFVLVSLLWSASGMFNNLAYEINKAWPEAKERNFVQSRLIGIDMILGLTGLLILSVVLDSLTKWLAGPNAANAPFSVWNPLAVISSLGSWIAIFLLYLATYRWVPTVHVAWSASIWGALAASLGWKAATTGFSWYLASPFAHYQLIYGSLGAIVAFLFLIYIIALVTLFGAHLTAAIDHLHRQRVAERAPKGSAASDTDIERRENSDVEGKPEIKPAPQGTTETHLIPVTGMDDAPEQEKDTSKPGDPAAGSADNTENANDQSADSTTDPGAESPHDATE
jgi:membrane protein